MTIRLALLEDALVPGARLSWRPAPRALYVRRGELRVTGAAGHKVLPAESCTLLEGALELEGDGEAWTFELSAGSVDDLSLADKARTILAHDIDRDPGEPVLLRADRVEFEPSGVTPRHGHRGPGIRRLVHGRLAAEIGREVRRIEPGTAWFETGADPVVGRNLAPSSAFVRAMALSPELKGKPTFIPWSPEEAAKPRGTKPRQFFDEGVRLPAS